ncbi:hypothetical protein V6Z11_D02G269000 [Gossypium hirsutum]
MKGTQVKKGDLESFADMFEFGPIIDLLSTRDDLDNAQTSSTPLFENRKSKRSTNIVLLRQPDTPIFVSSKETNIRCPFRQLPQKNTTRQPNRSLRILLGREAVRF